MKQRLKAFFFAILTFLIAHFSHAQVTTLPANPNSDEEVTIIYDATQGTSALQGATKVYMHAGAVLQGATSTAWENTVGNWGADNGVGQMTSIGNNKWSIKINPRTYFNVPASRRIFRIGMVFRSADGSKEGKSASGGDIFVDLRPPGFYMTLTSNLAAPYLNIGEKFTVTATTPTAADLSVSLGNTLLRQVSGATTLSQEVTALVVGSQWVKVTARSGATTVTDSIRMVVNPVQVTEALPAGVVDGINYKDDRTAILAFYAPGKKFAYLLGDFNDWTESPASFMKKTPDGNRFWLEVTNLTPQKEYGFQYLVDGNIRVADAYADKILDPDNDKWIEPTVYPNILPYPAGKTTGIVAVLQTAQQSYNWKVTNFKRPEKTDLVIYELHLRDFLKSHSYKELIDSLGYFKRLGVNAIELMPIMEFAGNDSWGYNPTYFFAPDKYYGTKNDLKLFIDKAHEMGFAVILDMVLNHIDGWQSPIGRLYWEGDAGGRPAANNPWLNPSAPHPYSVFHDFNHEAQVTKDFVDRVNAYWLKEYKFDGYRFDLAKGFTQKKTNEQSVEEYDASRVAIWKRIADQVWKTDPNAYVILEFIAASSSNQEEKEYADYGMLLWGNLNHAYGNTVVGKPSGNSLSAAYHGARGWSKPGLISYMESHDEERLIFRAKNEGEKDGSYNVRDLKTALERAKAAAAFYFPIPGPKMIWQFGELGYDVGINEFGGRVSRKPIRWEYYNEADRRRLYDTYAALIRLRSHEAFRSGTVTFEQESGGLIKKMFVNHSSMNTMVVGNFNVVDAEIELNFPSTGTWYDYFTGDTIRVIKNLPLTFKPGEFHIFTSKPLPKPQANLVPFAVPAKVLAIEDELFGKKVKLYPNPVSNGSFRIVVEATVAETVQVQITDLVGHSIYRTQSGKGEKAEFLIDLEQHPAGVYMVEIISGNIKTTKRLLKQ